MVQPLAQDMEHILAHTGGLWEALRGQRIFITGGTGFFGKWLLESFAWANDKLDLQAQAVVLTRNTADLAQRLGPIAGHPALRFHAGNVRDFTFPPGPFSHIIHAATESDARRNAQDPLRMLDTIVTGTRRVLDCAVATGARHVLLTSSGAVYGTQPPDLSHVPEDYPGAPDPLDLRSTYGQAKSMAEHLCVLYQRQHDLKPTIARCFAFVGPHLPLDTHFAIGNFIRDGLRGGPIVVAGDGTPYRSYLYAADLAVWLWTILLRGTPCRPYNVGGEAALSIADLAHQVADAFATRHGRRPVVKISATPRPGVAAARYVPSITRAAQELDLRPRISLPEALQRTLAWYQEQNGGAA